MIWDAVIAGGGCAGLAAATSLAERGFRVLVLERRPLLGGRASSFRDRESGETLDNGQHLFLGCYEETKRYLARIGSLSLLPFDESFSIAMAGRDGRRHRIGAARLPAPFHLLAGLLTYGALSLRERLSLGRAIRGLRDGEDLSGISVTDWLRRIGASERSRVRFWDPLTLAAINAVPDRAPAELLSVVLRNGFLSSRSASAIGLSTVGLSDLHGEPSQRFLALRGGEVRPRTAAHGLMTERDRLLGVRLSDGSTIPARAVVSAVPPPEARGLVRGVPGLERHLAPSEVLAPSAILSLHLWAEREPFREPFVGLWEGEFHWAFRHGRRVAMVKSSAEQLLPKGRKELKALAERELGALTGSGRYRAERAVISVEREATWLPPIGRSGARPAFVTPVPNFFLAGDWTGTGLPATFEGGVASGHRSAEAAAAWLRRPASLTLRERSVTVPGSPAIAPGTP